MIQVISLCIQFDEKQVADIAYTLSVPSVNIARRYGSVCTILLQQFQLCCLTTGNKNVTAGISL